jgi:cell division initiation protein
MLIEAQLEMLNNDDWDHLMEYELKEINVDEIEEARQS